MKTVRVKKAYLSEEGQRSNQGQYLSKGYGERRGHPCFDKSGQEVTVDLPPWCHRYIPCTYVHNCQNDFEIYLYIYET